MNRLIYHFHARNSCHVDENKPNQQVDCSDKKHELCDKNPGTSYKTITEYVRQTPILSFFGNHRRNHKAKLTFHRDLYNHA